MSYMCNKCNTARCKRYRETEKGKDNIYKAVYKSIKKFSYKQNARVILNRAVKQGGITKPTECLICSKKCKPHGHHDDYSKPLKVKWVCRKCHANIHKVK